MHWGTGILSATIFAFPHNLYKDKKGDLKLGFSFPLPFLTSGIYYWYLNRTRGFSFAFFSHSLNNLEVVVAIIGNQISRKNNEVK